jgi:prepilin-type N-terminal cleavage/methylation domain-containing protein
MRGKEKGFTLIEVMFAILVGMLLLGAAYVAMTAGQQSSAGVERKVAAQQDVRAAMQIMGLDLSMASYNPHYAPNIWHDLPGFGSVVQCTASGDQTFRGIREATPTAITVEMDIGESNLVGDDQGEIIRYNYNSTGQERFITRETVNCDNIRAASAASPFLGDSTGSGRPRSVRVINNDLNIRNGRTPVGDIAVFRYFDARNPANELYPHISSSQISQIRRIDITLAVETDEVDPATKVRKRMTYSTSVLVRNQAF